MAEGHPAEEKYINSQKRLPCQVRQELEENFMGISGVYSELCSITYEVKQHHTICPGVYDLF